MVTLEAVGAHPPYPRHSQEAQGAAEGPMGLETVDETVHVTVHVTAAGLSL